MPEAAVNKDDFLPGPEYEVRTPRDSTGVETIAESELIHQLTDDQFGSGVLAADTAHAHAALGWGEGIHLIADLRPTRDSGHVHVDDSLGSESFSTLSLGPRVRSHAIEWVSLESPALGSQPIPKTGFILPQWVAVSHPAPTL